MTPSLRAQNAFGMLLLLLAWCAPLKGPLPYIQKALYSLAYRGISCWK